MNKKNVKGLAIISMIIGCFASLAGNSYKSEKMIRTEAKTDYSHLNFDKGLSNRTLPSGYTFANSSGVDATPAFDSEGRYDLANGGSSSFTFDTKRPHGKRTTRFTLYENVKVEISMYTTGSGKKLMINNGSSTICNEEAQKNVDTIFTFEFTNVSPNGTTFYFGASSSGIYVNSIEFGAAERVKFDANGGQFADGTSSYRYEKPETGEVSIKVPTNPSRAGHIFKGWSVEKNSLTTVNNFEYGKTYYAVWVSLSNIILYLDEIAITLDVTNNRTKTLKVFSLPDADLINHVTVTWKSENPNIATVDNNGLVTSKALGSTYVVASVGTSSARCKVSVSQYSSHELVFYESYEDYQNNRPYSHASVNHGEALGDYSKPNVSPGAGYNFVWKADVNNTPDDTSDDVIYDFNSSVKQDLKIYAELTYMPLANIIEVIVPESSQVIKTSEREYYIAKVNQNMTLSIKYDRDDGRFDLIKDNAFFKNTMNDLTWYSSDPNVATVTNKGEVKFLKPGKVEIHASLYDHLQDTYGEEYSRHIIQATSVTLSSLGELKDDNGKTIDPTIGIKIEKGRFDLLGDETETAIRCIGFISDSFYQKIQDAKFRVEAINLQNEVQRVFEYKVTTFSRKIDYTSKTVANNTFKPWSAEGKLGTAFTITNLPSNEFQGTFKVTFMVTVDTGSSVVAANVAEKMFVGV